MPRMTLQAGRWYACEIFEDAVPGHQSDFTPIRIDSITPGKSGNRVFELRFFHASYPEGVQDKVYRLKTLYRGRHLILAQSLEHEPTRLLKIREITADWLTEHCSLSSRVTGDVQDYLNLHAGGQRPASPNQGGDGKTHELSNTWLRLPDPDQSNPDPEYEGDSEMRKFWKTGNIRDLPSNPSTGVALDWNNRMCAHGGYERHLARLGLDHQAVMDTVLTPAENGKIDHLSSTHPIILLHCLWRIAVQHGRCGYSENKQLIQDDDWIATCHFWNALLPQLREPNPKVSFIVHGSPPDRPICVQLGNENLHPQELKTSAAISPVWQRADFSQLPEKPTWREIEDLALILDGYERSRELLRIEDLFDWFNPIWDDHLENGAALPQSSLHLWLMLFVCQRAYLKDLGPPTKQIEKAIQNLYTAFRLAVQQEIDFAEVGAPRYLPAS